MLITAIWHDSCNNIDAPNPELMKMTITVNLMLILLYYFLLMSMVPF